MKERRGEGRGEQKLAMYGTVCRRSFRGSLMEVRRKSGKNRLSCLMSAKSDTTLQDAILCSLAWSRVDSRGVKWSASFEQKQQAEVSLHLTAATHSGLMAPSDDQLAPPALLDVLMQVPPLSMSRAIAQLKRTALRTSGSGAGSSSAALRGSTCSAGCRGRGVRGGASGGGIGAGGGRGGGSSKCGAWAKGEDRGASQGSLCGSDEGRGVHCGQRVVGVRVGVYV